MAQIFAENIQKRECTSRLQQITFLRCSNYRQSLQIFDQYSLFGAGVQQNVSTPSESSFKNLVSRWFVVNESHGARIECVYGFHFFLQTTSLFFLIPERVVNSFLKAASVGCFEHFWEVYAIHGHTYVNWRLVGWRWWCERWVVACTLHTPRKRRLRCWQPRPSSWTDPEGFRLLPVTSLLSVKRWSIMEQNKNLIVRKN